MIDEGNQITRVRDSFISNVNSLDKTQKTTLLTILVLALFVVPLSIISVGNRITLRPKAYEVVSPPTPPTGGNHPPILSVSLRKVRVGVYFETNVVGKDKDADDTLTITAANLPNGIELSNCNESVSRSGKMLVCKLAGSVSEKGSYEFTLKVVDSSGLTDEKTAVLQVN